MVDEGKDFDPRIDQGGAETLVTKCVDERKDCKKGLIVKIF